MYLKHALNVKFTSDSARSELCAVLYYKTKSYVHSMYVALSLYEISTEKVFYFTFHYRKPYACYEHPIKRIQKCP